MHFALPLANGSDVDLELTSREHLLLRDLISHLGNVRTHGQLQSLGGGARRVTVDAALRGLRDKLLASAPTEYALFTERSIGHRLVIDDPARVRSIDHLSLTLRGALRRAWFEGERIDLGEIDVVILDVLMTGFGGPALPDRILAERLDHFAAVTRRNHLGPLNALLLNRTRGRVGIVGGVNCHRLADNRVRFGALTLAEVDRTISWDGGEPVSLPRGACNVLRTLIARDDHAAMLDDLRSVFVDGREGTLPSLRQTLVKLADALAAATGGTLQLEHTGDVARLVEPNDETQRTRERVSLTLHLEALRYEPATRTASLGTSSRVLTRAHGALLERVMRGQGASTRDGGRETRTGSRPSSSVGVPANAADVLLLNGVLDGSFGESVRVVPLTESGYGIRFGEPIVVGPFDVNHALQSVRRGDTTARLTPTTLPLVLALATRAGRVVTFDELCVAGSLPRGGGGATLQTRMALVRKALLGFDDIVVQSVISRGYCLLVVPPPAWRLWVGAIAVNGSARMVWPASPDDRPIVLTPVEASYVAMLLAYVPSPMPGDAARQIARLLAPDLRYEPVLEQVSRKLRHIPEIWLYRDKVRGHEIVIQDSRRWRFGPIELEPAERIVQLADARLALPPAEFGCFVLMVVSPAGVTWAQLKLRAGLDDRGIRGLVRRLDRSVQTAFAGAITVAAHERGAWIALRAPAR